MAECAVLTDVVTGRYQVGDAMINRQQMSSADVSFYSGSRLVVRAVEYREFGSERIKEVIQIYDSQNWSNYLADETRLKCAFDQSFYVLGAFDSGELVGFVRCVGDGEFIIYVQDLIIRPSHLRIGIGSELMGRAAERFSNVRQFLLITDSADEAANAFYRAIGMTELARGFR